MMEHIQSIFGVSRKTVHRWTKRQKLVLKGHFIANRTNGRQHALSNRAIQFIVRHVIHTKQVDMRFLIDHRYHLHIKRQTFHASRTFWRCLHHSRFADRTSEVVQLSSVCGT
jgi:transposase